MPFPYTKVPFSTLVGKLIVEIERKGDKELVFHTTDGIYKMFHEQDCCEDVHIEDICGDLNDLLNRRVTQAVESTSNDLCNENHESATWTFYLISSDKGSVNIRWYGASNGYYSERADLWHYT